MPSPKTPLAHIVGSRGAFTTGTEKFAGAQKNSRPWESCRERRALYP
jgi:hypothetical protein